MTPIMLWLQKFSDSDITKKAVTEILVLHLVQLCIQEQLNVQLLFNIWVLLDIQKLFDLRWKFTMLTPLLVL